MDTPKTRKPRVKLSEADKLIKLTERAEKATRLLALANARKEGDNIPALKNMRDNLAFHRKLLLEGSGLQDDEKYGARLANLEKRIAALKAKRGIAVVDYTARNQAIAAFEEANLTIGQRISQAAVDKEVVSEQEITDILNKHLSPEQVALLSSKDDVYAKYRRQKKEVADMSGAETFGAAATSDDSDD